MSQIHQRRQGDIINLSSDNMAPWSSGEFLGENSALPFLSWSSKFCKVRAALLS